MTQTGKNVAVGALICACCLGFLGLIAYQNSEQLSALRVQSMLRSFHSGLVIVFEESNVASKDDLRESLAQSPISSSSNFLALVVDSQGELVADNWEADTREMPDSVLSLITGNSSTSGDSNTLMMNDVLVSWHQGEISKTPYSLILVYLETDRAWGESLRVFVVPLIIALVIGAWSLAWLALMFRGIFSSEVVARQLAEDARLHAEKANLAKSDFLSMISHELRTPLNGIIGFAQVLLFDKGTTLKGDHADSAEQILKAGEQLLGLINQILDLSAIEAGGSPLHIEDVDAAALTDECVAMMEKAAEAKQLRIEMVAGIADKTPIVQVDRTRLKQVLLNLLGNAIKYNTTGKLIKVQWQLSGKQYLRLSVTDDGPGIEEKHHNKVFEPFNRLGMGGGDIEGSGIGLSISKRIVELMGGRIGFDSLPGERTTFWFEIELCRLEFVQSKTEQVSLASAGIQEKESFSDVKNLILYIEDNAANSLLMKRIVSRMDSCELISTTTAEAGIEIAKSLEPELILMDINLPGMGGVEALSVLKADNKTAAIPVVAVSAVAMESDIQRGKDAGFSGYLTKPLNITETLKIIGDVLGKRDSMQA